MDLFRRTVPPLGAQGEQVAARYLRRRGYKILGTNVHLGSYEIDIIARKGDTTAFVEVKTRRDASVAQPEVNVGYTKRQHIRRAARRYIAQVNDPERYYRFDIAAVILPERGKPAVTYYENAFPGEE